MLAHDPAPPAASAAERPGVLYLSVGLIAVCGIIYELAIGAASSYLLGDSLWQFSITIGLFLSALGLGAYLSQWFERRLFGVFVATELAIGMVGGFSALWLFAAYGLSSELYPAVQYGLTLLIGTLVGLEIPLLMRMLEGRHDLRYNAAYVLSLDYVGGLVGSLAFPLVLFPQLGLIRATLLVGLLNSAVALLGLWRYAPRFVRRRRALALACGAVLASLAFAFWRAPAMEAALEQRLYRDTIVSSRQTPYQHLTLTRDGDDLRLFINGNLQYSSLDEYRYHEALVHVPIGRLGAPPRDVLVLGGGDGLAARELLKYPSVRRIDLVDLDGAMTAMHRTEPALVALNGGSLASPELRLHVEDALKFLARERGFYDLVVIDLPDPNSEALAKLYTREFYALVARHVRPAGAFVVQASSPYFSRQAFWCIAKTVEAAGLVCTPYHVDVPSFGDWGFVLASPRRLPEAPWRAPDGLALRYVTPELVPGFFRFGRDEDANFSPPPEVHRVFHPVLLRYYEQGWGKDR